ncbi:GTP-binding protein 2-like [Gigantopelta aegis]|uniref:GTP-binding protein 2-like n=1 Tax=Gigantopelta aegis TaxID=1735272 RepID=UPI001B889417|nr:GTP-binding protein 2-like [Gigantopelta aegis]
MENLIDMADRSSSVEMPECLPPEEEEGNVEYKLKLVNPTNFRIEHLITQMKWRLEEGEGEAIYEIGVEDNGMLAGLADSELEASIQTLQTMAKRLGASLTVLREKTVAEKDSETGKRRRAMEVLVRKVPDDQEFIDLRLAVLGNVDAGKSTLLGVLTHGELDNGRGRARLNLFRHLHEIQSGRTSSISHEIIGFDSSGEIVNYSGSRSVEDICEASTKLITLIDLAGHHKYLKTTIFGLTGNSPDCAMLTVNASTGMAGTTKEHLGYAMALRVPVFVVVTKIDLCRSVMVEKALRQLELILKGPGCKKVPIRIKTEDDAITAASNFDSEAITPIFMVSSVNGKNLDLLRKFLNVLPPLKSRKDREKLVQHSTEFQIDELFSVPGVGSVVGGNIRRGSIREGDKVMLGPYENGLFRLVKVKTVQRNRLPCRLIQAGQTATVALLDVEREELRKGMVLVSNNQDLCSCREFEADVYVLFHTSRISTGFQITVHIGTVCQTAVIVKMNQKYIRTNEKACVTFRLIKQPEYICPGARLLFRDGKTKGMGEVLKIFPYEHVER